MLEKKKKISLGLIIANEFCERFCYYGMRALLFMFLRQSYSYSQKTATSVVHGFNFLCYFFTFVGGILSDYFLGRYKTILYLSIVYFIGTVCMTTSTVLKNERGYLFIGLFFISLGTGGIKPCISTFGGDQFDNNEINALKSFFNYFYFSINAGSMLSIFGSPYLSKFGCMGDQTCYPLAFGLPAVLLGISIILFLLGSNTYVKKEPDKGMFFKICSCVWFSLKKPKTDADTSNTIDRCWLESSKDLYGEEFVNDLKDTLRILRIFLPVSFFWMLYDQQASVWINQATKMNNKIRLFNYEMEIIPSQMQALNAISILLFIPLFTGIIYPYISTLGYEFNSLKKMFSGMVLGSFSFFIAAYVEYKIEINTFLGIKNEHQISILWQVPQYLIITAAEILLGMTGLEFAYSESPLQMKSLILSGWLITVAIGNFYVMLFTSLDIVNFLRIRRFEMWNYVLYGFIGLIASVLMYRSIKIFKSRNAENEV